ncbi:MAG: M14 family zinc carboxypeptidase, partial [Planctomycetota bacterium]
ELETLDALGLDYEVTIPDVDRLIALERQAIDELRLLRGIDWYTTYRTNAEFNSYFTELLGRFGPAGTENPGLLTTEIIGQSVEGRDITALRINPPGATANTRPAVFLNGGLHAREWVNHATTMYIAEELMTRYGSDPRVTNILDNLEFLIVPVSNPDGYEYAWQSGGTRLWRKNRRPNSGGSFGVDLNRNWDIFFAGPGADNIQSSDLYHGPSAFSEPETSALRDLHNSHPQVVAHIDIHSFSQLILWPWGYGFVSAPEPDNSLFISLGNAMSQAIQAKNGAFYTPQQSVDLYPASGTCSDWFYSQGAFSYTFELRDTGSFGFILPPEQIIPTAEENFEAILVMGDTFSQPISVAQIGQTPITLAPLTDTTVTFTATPTYGDLDPASPTLFYRVNGGAWQQTALGAVGPVYQAIIPGADCGDTVEYYAQFSTTDPIDVTFPTDISHAISITYADSQTTLVDNAESDAGWTVGLPGDTATTGLWELGDPVPTGAQPGSDHTPAPGTLCFVTGASGASLGSDDVDDGFTTLITPALDASASATTYLGGDPFVRYYRWYINNAGASPGADILDVDISNDNGATWTDLEAVGSSATDWIEATFRIADFVTPTDQIKLRFIAEDAGGGSIVEAAIDDLEIFFAGCDTPADPADLTTTGGDNGTPDGVVDLSDFSYYLARWSESAAVADVTTTGTSNGVPDTNIDLSDFSYYLGLWATATGG